MRDLIPLRNHVHASNTIHRSQRRGLSARIMYKDWAEMNLKTLLGQLT